MDEENDSHADEALQQLIEMLKKLKCHLMDENSDKNIIRNVVSLAVCQLAASASSWRVSVRISG